MKRVVLATTAASLLAATIATPAEARRWHHRHHDRVDAGDVVAGVAVVGGIAALASAITKSKRASQDAAVDRCVGEAEDRAQADLLEITHVDKRKGYYSVEGMLDDAGAETAFTCTVRNGRIYSLHLSGEDA